MKSINIFFALIISALLSSCGFNLKNYKIGDDPSNKQSIEKDLTTIFKDELLTKLISEVFTFSQQTFFFYTENYVEVHVDEISYKHSTKYDSKKVDSFINQWFESGYAPGYLDDIFDINTAGDGLSQESKLIAKKNEMISDKFKEIDSNIDTNTAFLWERRPYVENSNVLTYKVTAYLTDVYSKDFLIKFQLNSNDELEYFVE